MRLRESKRFARALTIVAGCLLAIAAGFACQYSFADPLKRASYDLPFVLRTTLDTHEIVLVYLDEESARQLHQPIDDKWNRALHIPLLERLTKDEGGVSVPARPVGGPPRAALQPRCRFRASVLGGGWLRQVGGRGCAPQLFRGAVGGLASGRGAFASAVVSGAVSARLGACWRALHRARGAGRLVFYDIVFDTPSLDPAKDEAFAAELESFGKAILGATLEIVQPMGGVKQERVVPSLKLLRKAAAGWGTLAFAPDADYGVRQLFVGSDMASATWKAAEFLGAKATREPRESAVRRWINYYGPANTFSSINFAKALAPEGVRAGFFKR